jgi:hypothetical protein
VKVKIARHTGKIKIIGEIVPQGYFNVPHNRLKNADDYYIINKRA